jgi:hypothetical protein
MLEKDGDNNLDRSYVKLRNITQSQRRREHPTYRLTEFVASCTITAFENALLKERWNEGYK